MLLHVYTPAEPKESEEGVGFRTDKIEDALSLQKVIIQSKTFGREVWKRIYEK